MKIWVKALVSLALLFHLFAVFVFPNPESLLSRRTSWLVFPYGNLLGLNTTWRFFSPNPVMKVFEYEAYRYDESGDIVFEQKARFPESLEAAGSRETFNRLMNFAMYGSSREESIENVLKPYFCKKFPSAEVSFYLIDYVLPSLESARLKAGNFESMARERKVPLARADCPGGEG